MERGMPSSPPAPVGGAEMASTGKGETAEEAAVMTSRSAETGSSTGYLHSSRSGDPSTSSSIRSIPGIVGVTAGVVRHSSITAPVTVRAGAACHSNFSTVPAGEEANCIIKGGWP